MKTLKCVGRFIVLTSLVGLLSACGSQPSASQKNSQVTVGTMAGPETSLMRVAADVAKKRYGLHVKIITFSNYEMPNAALANGSLDANMFQHMPFLKSQIKDRGYHLVSIGRTFVYPMAAYSKKIKSIYDIKNGAQVAIPNDPSNEARALLLLQKQGLIGLKKGVTITATPRSIVSNPKHLQFVELNAAQLPRALNDVTMALINTNYALPAGLSLKSTLFQEGEGSLYANLIVVREKDQHSEKLEELVKAFQSDAVLRKAKQLFGDAAVRAW